VTAIDERDRLSRLTNAERPRGDKPETPHDELLVVVEGLGPDERAVLLAIAKRLAHGRRHYGPLDVRGDRRDWRGEAAEEALDLSVYMACELLRGAE
jgi:hypothetical protein